jgi:hypothetical protein
MAYVLDESSYRIDKNTFPTADEAQDRAGEAARILGRPVTVYELVNQELHFAFRVHPDGRKCKRDPLPEHEPIEPTAPAVLGRRELLDTVAEVLEQQGRFDLAAALDAEDEVVGADDALSGIVDQLKQDDTL